MALREANYVFTRRIADRGNDKIVFDLQDRKIQETDSKDVIWDEIVGKEEHPEDYDGYKFQETDSVAFIRDENCGKEEYPGNCSVIYPLPPCFDEYEDEEWYSWFTGNGRNLPGDESGSESFKVEGVTRVENGGVTVTPVGEMMSEKKQGITIYSPPRYDVGKDAGDDDLKTSINLDKFLSGEKLVHAVVIGGVRVARDGDAPKWES
ncbi:hypothetical protein Hanom_Chr02g00155571 [Helianthus anomalus]